MKPGENTGTVGNLKPPFQRGVSGNPGGRPSHAAIRAALRPHDAETIDRLLDHMRGGDATQSMNAIKLILAYLHGQPNSVQVDDLSTDELLAVLVRRKERDQAEAQARQ